MPNKISRYCDGIMEACWLLALVITPLFFNIYSSRVFEPDKITLLRSLALIVAAAWLVKIISEGGLRFEILPQHPQGPLAAFYRLPLVVPVGALMLAYIISSLFSVSPHATLFGSYQRLQGTFTMFSYLVMFAAVAANLRRRAQVERALTTVVLTSLPISLYGLLQRYRLDPLPWGGDTVSRITGNMGNAIFIAAYLIMSALVALGRVVTSFRAIMTDEDNSRMVSNVIRATAYIFIFALNLIAIWFSFSRGPWLGLLAGSFFFFVILALYWRVRWLALSAIGLSALLAVFLVLLNIPNGPLDPLREVPGVGRLGQVFETEGGTGRVRVLIWGGVIRLITPHPPIENPDGSTDRWNVLRPFIGYGPEALYVAFNPFYPPELGQLEARNATPDRSHNETFDALAITGLLGLAVHFALFVLVFYYSLKWLGLITTRNRRLAFFALVLGGGLASSAGFVAWQGPEFFGVGLPLGMLLGLIGFLTMYALLGTAEVETARLEPWRAITLISLFAAIVAHFTEIHFGIAIVSTRSHFWIYTGLLFVVGFALPAGQAAPGATPLGEAAPRSRRRARAASGATHQTLEKWGPTVISAGLLAAILITLAFDFVANPIRSTSASDVLAHSLTLLPTGKDPVTGQVVYKASFGVLGLVLATWLIGGLVASLEEGPTEHNRLKLDNLGITLGLSLLAGGAAWLALAGYNAAAATPPRTQATTAQQVIDQVTNAAMQVANVLAVFYFLILLLLLAWAWALMSESPAPLTRPSGLPLAVKGLAYVGLPLIAAFLAVRLNMQVIQADIIYKTGFQFDAQNQPQLSIPLYQRAIAMSPGEDYYYLFLGRSYLNTTNALTDEAQRQNVLQQAEKELKVAQRLNPLNPDHTANLARLNRQWAAITSDSAIRDERIRLANQYYESVLRLSRNSVVLWGEWALLAYEFMNDYDLGQQRLDHSFALDNTYEQTYLYQGDLLARRAQRDADPARQQDYYQRAIAAYLSGIEAAERRSLNTTHLRINLANAYVAIGQLPLAIEQYIKVGQSNDPTVSQWQLYQQISDLYRQLGDIGQARQYAQLALDAAPEANKPQVQQYLDGLK